MTSIPIWLGGYVNKQELMKLAPLFMGLSEAEQETIAEQFTAAECKNGTPLFSIGDQSDALYLIGQGFVRLQSQGGQSLATLGPGSILGESSLFRGEPYDVSADCRCRCPVLATDRSAIAQDICLSNRQSVSN